MKKNLVTRRELATILDVHQMTVTKWEQAGMPIAERGRRGKASLYDEVAVRAWLEAREEAARNGNNIDLVRARAEKEHWQGQKARLDYEKGVGNLLPREDVEKAWLAEITGARAIMLGIPTSYSDQIHRVAITDGVIGVERELKRAIREALTELSLPERATALEAEKPRETPPRKPQSKKKRTKKKAKKRTARKR